MDEAQLPFVSQYYFCRDARNRQLIWNLAKQSEAHLDRLIVLEERANAQREIANILNRESVLARNGLAATVEGAVGALQQFNERLEHSLNPGRFRSTARRGHCSLL